MTDRATDPFANYMDAVFQQYREAGFEDVEMFRTNLTKDNQ